MNILHVNHLLDPVSGGGTAVRTLQLTRFLMRESVNCAILCLDIGDTQDSEKKLIGARIHKLPCLNRRFFIPRIWPSRLNKLISEFDVVHLMGHWTLLNAIVALICIRQNKPYVVCPAGALKSFGRSIFLKRVYDLIIGRRIIRSANAWVAITEEEKHDFTDYGIDVDLVAVIPNGVDPTDYEFDNKTVELQSFENERIGLTNVPYILFFGRLNEIKGPDLLLEAFAAVSRQYPDLHLIFAGPDAGMLSVLQASVSREGLTQRIHFVGYLSGPEKVNIMRNAQCMVIPSREEAMSIVVLEAGMCSTPVIFTDRCGLDDFERAGAGLMVHPSVVSIRDGLMSALSDLEALRESGRRLQAMVNGQFLWGHQAQRYVNVYQKLISS